MNQRRRMSISLVAFATALFGAAAAFADSTPVIVESHFTDGYIPDGFDSNDTVEIVGAGFFRNTCYKPAHVEVSVDAPAMRIELRPQSYFYDALCLQVLVPYHEVVNLGILGPGRYKVINPDRKLELGELNIRIATSANPDDYLYATISQAYFKTENGKDEITISGQFTNSCMRLVDVITHVQPKVVTVQPISEMRAGPGCADGKFPFERTIEVSGLHHGQRYLIHVRSLNGKSVNNLVDVE